MPVDWGEVLNRLSKGDPITLSRLMPAVYEELRKIARRHLRRERPDHTLQTTALVNEVYMRFAGQTAVRWENRAHFMAAAAELMRRILIDHARAHCAAKRGGGVEPLSVEEATLLTEERGIDLLSLDEALRTLAAFDPRQSRIVELRFFGGMTVDEVAEVMSLSSATVKREWRIAKGWLLREIRRGRSA